MSKLEDEDKTWLDDTTWLKEKMLKESEEIEVPESLSPDSIRKKLEHVEQKHFYQDWRKSAAIAASFVIVASASLQAGKMIERKGNAIKSNMPVEVTDHVEPQQTMVTADITGTATPENKPGNSAATNKNPVTQKKPGGNKQDQHGYVKPNTTKKEPVTVSKTRSFKEGNGKRTVTDGDIIYSGDGKDIVVQKYADNQVTEMKRMEVNKEPEEFYMLSSQLVCIASDKQEGTTVYTYNVGEDAQLEEASSLSVEGDYQCSYQEGEELYVFTDTGKVQKINTSENQSTTFSVEETGAKYFVSGQSIYTLKASDEGTSIQSYKIENDTLEKGESTKCSEPIDNILAIQGEGDHLELLSAKKDGISFLQYDEQMRLVNEKNNKLGDTVFAGEFTDDGILVFGNEDTKLQLSMLSQNSLETKSTVSIEGVSSVSIGDLAISENESVFGFAASSAESEESTYYVYDYDQNKGFKEAKTQQVDTEKVENDFVVGDSVLVTDSDGVGVLVE